MTRVGDALEQTPKAGQVLPWEPPAERRKDARPLIALADEILEKCRGEGPANCAQRCPLHVDARGYVQLAKQGRFQEALQLVRDKLPFPGILGYVCAHPCELHCKKVDEEAPIRIRDIKRFLADHETGAPQHLVDCEPPREKRIAIVGAGPAGLIAAYDLKRRGYPVTIFEREEQIGGCLRYKLPSFRLPQRVLERDLSVIEALEIEVITGVDVGTETSLAELKRDFDAVLLLAGYKGGLDLVARFREELKETVRETLFADPVTCETGLDGVFASGDAVTGPGTVISSLGLGRRCAESAHRYLSGEDLAADREGPLPARLLWTLEVDEKERQARVRTPVMLKPHNAAMTEEEVRAEGERCLDCECGLCVEDCEFLKKHCESPRDLARKVKAGLTDQDTLKMVFSCNICSLCEAVCPEGLDTGKMLLTARQEAVKAGIGPLDVHKGIVSYWKVGVSDLFSHVMPAPGRTRAKALFFTGCGLPATAPGLTVEIYNQIRRHYPDTGVLQICCGAPVGLLGMEENDALNRKKMYEMIESVGAEEVWTACPDCMHYLQEGMPDVRVSTIWEQLADVWEPPQERNGARVSIHDSCKGRHAPSLHSSVRKILEGGGAAIEDVEYNKEKARCCGFGGMIYPVDPELSQAVSKRRSSESPLPMITYCAGCRMALKGCGKESIHILDFLYSKDFEKKAAQAPPGFLGRYVNRLKAKWQFKRLRPLDSE